MSYTHRGNIMNIETVIMTAVTAVLILGILMVVLGEVALGGSVATIVTGLLMMTLATGTTVVIIQKS